MTCKTVAMHGGGAAIVCSRGGRRVQRCIECGAEAALLCDWPVEDGTCDAPICRVHARSAGRGIDYCPRHEGDPTP